MIRLLLTLLIAALSATAHAQVREPIHAGTGELPVILTAPHGGTQTKTGCEERTGGRYALAARVSPQFSSRCNIAVASQHLKTENKIRGGLLKCIS